MVSDSIIFDRFNLVSHFFVNKDWLLLLDLVCLPDIVASVFVYWLLYHIFQSHHVLYICVLISRIHMRICFFVGRFLNYVCRQRIDFFLAERLIESCQAVLDLIHLFGEDFEHIRLGITCHTSLLVHL